MEVGPGVDQHGAANLIFAGLPDADLAASVEASLEGFGIGNRVIIWQEAVLVGVFHMISSGAGSKQDQRQNGERYP